MSTLRTPVNHIRVDDNGRAWIEGTSYPVLTVVMDYIAHGLSPEEIYFEHYEEIPLAAIYAGLAFYHDHRNEMDAEIGAELKI